MILNLVTGHCIVLIINMDERKKYRLAINTSKLEVVTKGVIAVKH